MSETIVSVERALDILLLLYYEGGELSYTDIITELNLAKSSGHRLLAILEKKNFVERDPKSERYRLGYKLYPIGLLAGEHRIFQDVVGPFAEALHQNCQEVVNVSVLDFDEVRGYTSVVAYKINNPAHVVSINPIVGSSFEAHVSSVGKCLLAFNKDVDLSFYKNKEFTPYTPNSITSFEALKKELDDVREKGYALDREEREIGLYCIGAPIFNAQGNAIAAISLSGPTSRMHNAEEQDKIDAVIEAAKNISKLTI